LGHQDAGSCGSCDLTEVDTPTAMGGALGYAAEFLDASVQYAKRTDDGTFDPGTSDFWLSTWMKLHSLPNTGTVFYKGAAAAGEGQPGYWLRYNGTPQVLIYFSDGSADRLLLSSAVQTLIDARVHVLATFDRDDKMHLYINGIEEGTGVSISAQNGSIDSATDLYVGGTGGTTMNVDGLFGQMTYGLGLPGSAVRTSIYNSGKGKACADLTAAEKANMDSCWEMDEAGGPYTDTISSEVLTAVNTPTRANGLV
ncbi:unnamed protein product, partial [marine sediment metagenome]